MSMFDFFGKEASLKRKRATALKTLTNMYYQKLDRLAAAENAANLVRQGDAESVLVLASRFDHISPSPTGDTEEKEFVVSQLIGLGESLVQPLIPYCLSAKSPIYWHLQVLDALWSNEKLAKFIAEVLATLDNEYCRDPEKKIQLTHMAGDFPFPEIGPQLVRFFDDHHEPVRFNSCDSVFRIRYAEAIPALIERMTAEDSLRVANHIARGFADCGWSMPNLPPEAVRKIPADVRLQPDGSLVRLVKH